jgi:L-arabinonolactonase
MAELMVDARNALGECVLWCERTGRVLWTDILGSVLWIHDGREARSIPMPERLASFALTDSDDRLLLGLASRLAFYDFSTGVVTTICEVEADLPGTRLNDGRCDRQGRFVFGTFNQDEPRLPIGAFYRLNGDLTLEKLPLPPVAIANSTCFSPDGATMYFCDSPDKAIRCCDYDTVTGAISNVRLFAKLDGGPGEPDGSCIDADGYLWNAEWGASRVVRYAPDGTVERIVPVAATQPSCVAIGGAGLDTLFISSALVGLATPVTADGGLFSAAIGPVRGLPEARFIGQ